MARKPKKGLGDLKGLKAPKKKAKPAPKPKPKPEPKSEAKPPEKKAPYSSSDREAFEHAFAGVRALDAPAEGARPPKKKAKGGAPRKASAAAALQAAEESARARLDQLVGGGVSFIVTRGEHVRGRRERCPERTLRMLENGELPPESRLDLHGMDRSEASRAIRGFVREEHRRGRRTLCIIHGKGKHSEGGIGVLQSTTISALTGGGAAPLVEAFASAPERLGGTGAIIVRLSAK